METPQENKDADSIRHFKGSVGQFKQMFDDLAGGKNTNAYSTPEYQGFKVHPVRGDNKSPHWEESNEDEKTQNENHIPQFTNFKYSKDMLAEGWKRDPESIRKEYKELKKQSIDYLRKEWSRINRVGNPKSLDKEGLISDLLRGFHGDKYVDKAFEGIEVNEAAIDGDRQMITRAIENMASGRLKVKDIISEIRNAIDQAKISSTMKQNLKFNLKVSEGKVNEYGQLNEMDINDPILVAIRARKTMLAKRAKIKIPTEKQYYKLMDAEIDLINKLKDARRELEELDSEMNQEAGQKGDAWTDDDANRYGGDLDKLQTKIEKLAKQKLGIKKAIMNYRIH